MKKQTFVYGLFALALFASAGLTQFDTSNVADVVTISSSQTMNDERRKLERYYESEGDSEDAESLDECRACE